MSILKDIAKSLATRFLSATEIQELAPQSKTQVAVSANGYFRREAGLLDRTSKEYVDALTSAEGFILSHYKASSFIQMCRSFVRRNSKPEYYLVAAIGQIIAEARGTIDPSGVTSGGEAGQFVEEIRLDITAAHAETNVIKKRSILRKAIQAKLPELTGDRVEALVGMILLLPQ